MSIEKQKTAKRGRPPTGHKLSGSSERFHREYAGQEPLIVEHPGPDENSVPEKSADDLSIAVSNHKFPRNFGKLWTA